MKNWLMDILACPAKDCRHQLRLEVYQSHHIESQESPIEEIDEALITCPNCGRWYPVIDGIPCMLPDDMRITGKQRTEEESFLRRWNERIPSEILKSGKPFGLEEVE